MESKLKIGDPVIVPAWLRGLGETIKAVVTEIDPVYYEAALTRFCQHIAQRRLF